MIRQLSIFAVLTVFLALGACATTGVSTNRISTQEPATIKRSFVDGVYGQVHVRVATPPSGNSAKRPLLLLHPTPYSSQFFLPFMKEMQTDRLVVAMDTPGYGDSARPAAAPTMQDYAANALKVLDALGISEPVDAVGYHTGTLIAVEMSLAAPERINKMILPGIPVYPSERLPGLFKKYAKPEVLDKDGSHLMTKWSFATQTMDVGLPLEGVQSHFGDYMQSMPYSTQAYTGVFSYPGYDRLPEISTPSLYVAINGSLKQETVDAQKITPGSSLKYLDHITTGLFDIASDQMADISREYFD